MPVRQLILFFLTNLTLLFLQFILIANKCQQIFKKLLKIIYSACQGISPASGQSVQRVCSWFLKGYTMFSEPAWRLAIQHKKAPVVEDRGPLG
jgi:hypothetical protein